MKITLICKLFFLFLPILSGMKIAVAQTVKISGIVVLAEDASPLPGTAVHVKGTSIGVVTDIQGMFSLNVPTEAKVLTVSYVGMLTQEVEIASFVRVALRPDVRNLDEVVVTGMGIKRSEKSLGYATTEISGEELTRAREDNILNALAGKVAGVRVMRASGTPGGASGIQIRGASSVGAVSSPLFVVDGLPIDNSSYNPDDIIGSIDAGNRAGDLALDDVESVNILKGAAAAALYGARAKDGAIIITTRKGSKNAKTSVNVHSSTRFESVFRLPDFQNEYAQGNEGVYNMKATNGWGPDIAAAAAAGTKYPGYNGEEITLQAYPDNVKDFYRPGISYINSLSMAGGGEKGDFRTAFSSFNQKGIVPGADYNKYTFSVNAGADLLPGLSARVSAQYIRSDSEGRTAQGANDANVLVSLLNDLPRTRDIRDLRDNWIDENGKQITLDPDGNKNNPYWLVNKNKYTTSLNRLIGSVSLAYSPVEGLRVSNNLGTDYYTETRRKIYAKGTAGELNGKFQAWDLTNRIINNDLMVTYEKSFGDFGFKGIAGHNINQRERTTNSALANGLVVEDLYTLANAESVVASDYYEIKRLTGLYFDFGFSYKSMVFINVTGRNDWSSTLPVHNRSYFYPSVSGSFVFSELIGNKNVLSFGKLRLNYANVGSDGEPYQLKFQYKPVGSYTLQYGVTNTFPHNGLVGFSGPVVLPLENLKPQNQNAFEIGVDLRFLDSRVSLDATYYRNVTTNQIVAISVPASTGYRFNNINAGRLTNKGIEIELGLVPVKWHDFHWNLDVNFSSNKQIVNELGEGLTDYSLANSFDGVAIKAEVGKPFGIYGKGWKRDDAGNFIINEATGFYETENGVRLGDIYPDFMIGVNNSFVYKGFSLGVLIDIRQGGKLYSGTIARLRSAGLAAETAVGRETPVVLPGLIRQEDGTVRQNDVPVESMQVYWNNIGKNENAEGSLFDASYVKVRELTFSYIFPRQWFNNFFIKSLELGLEGRNLWLIKSKIPHIDPEVNFLGPGSIGEGVELSSLPSTRSFGFNVKLAF